VADVAPAGGIAHKGLRAIATAARTSHRMLIHHFGSREGLHTGPASRDPLEVDEPGSRGSGP
jgi:hypothetical protein